MNDQDLELFLARAQRELSPSEGDLERVQAALGAALASPSNTSVPARSAVKLQPWLARALGVLALGAAGASGYAWGYRDGSVRREAATMASSTAVERRPPAPAPSVPTAVDQAATAPAAGRQTVPLRAARPVPALVTSGAPSSEAPALTLDDEVRELRRIERALRDDNPRLALVIGESLDAALPRGQLRLERQAARLMAQCQLESDGAREQAAEFVNANRAGAFSARLEQICGLGQRNAPGAGTNEQP